MIALPVITACGECKFCTTFTKPNARISRNPTPAEIKRATWFTGCEHPKRPRTGSFGDVPRVEREQAPPTDCPMRVPSVLSDAHAADRELIETALAFDLDSERDDTHPLDPESIRLAQVFTDACRRVRKIRGVQ